MAVTSLQAISVLGDSPGPASRQVAAEGSQRTHSSSVLQMWRKIEDGQAGSLVEQRTKALRQQSDEINDDISTQTSESNCSEQRAYLEEIAENLVRSDLDGDETRVKTRNHDGEGKSPAIGEAERERVRQIFRDWMSCGGREHSSNPTQMSKNSKAQWLGDSECERVRVVREWVQLTAHDSGSYSDRKEIAKIGAEIEMVRDGLVVDQNEGRPNRAHRLMRRLCGKQALLDLIVKAERERQSELDNLKKHHAVSRFPHRNRIQALLKGRFLRSNVSSEKQKPRSTAAGELGLLRRRQTVSGLREGFLSRTDSSGQSPIDSANDHVASPSSNAIASCMEESHTDTEEETAAKCDELNNSTKEDHDIPDLQSLHLSDPEETRLQSDGSLTVVNEEAIQDNEVNIQQAVGAELTIPNGGTVPEEISQVNTNERSQCLREQVGEVEGDNTHAANLMNLGSSIYIDDLSTRVVENSNLQSHSAEDDATRVQGSVNEEGRLDRVAYNDWRNTLNNNMGNGSLDVRGQSLDYTGNEIVESVISEGHHTWDASESEDSVEDWLQSPSRQDSGAFASSDTLFFGLVEENVRTFELNELVGRRRVSNLLESGFRENLNRLLQRYVERQTQSSMSWDLDDSISSPASGILHQGHQAGNENEHSGDTLGPSSYSGAPPARVRLQQLGDQVSWTHTVHQPLGFDWEVISDLRMDITTLQLRMNDMQRMLEACMDMQLELQRSIRQEVSAALNRSAAPGPVDSDLADDESKWELVRKGICCVCSDRNIDSLLYRCGHMCTCTSCATNLLNEKRKCPMCRSPIIEVIRAYSAQQ